MIFPRLLLITVCFLCYYLTVADTTKIENSNPPSTNETFMYFAYGSNLLSKRILIQNPTAKRSGIGKLKNYRLDFNTHSQFWNGSTADLIEEDGEIVWGAIWEIDVSNMKDLDRQEGVERKLYKVLTKIIETPTGEQITCRLYQQVSRPEKTNRLEDLPLDLQPSRTYLNCILKGAEESQLPIEYINGLRRIPHNNRDAPDSLVRILDL